MSGGLPPDLTVREGDRGGRLPGISAHIASAWRSAAGAPKAESGRRPKRKEAAVAEFTPDQSLGWKCSLSLGFETMQQAISLPCNCDRGAWRWHRFRWFRQRACWV